MAGAVGVAGKIPTFDSFDEMDACRMDTEISFGFLRPGKVRLEIRPSRSQTWSADELAKLMRPEQGSVFEASES
jgi:hypothetical protein